VPKLTQKQLKAVALLAEGVACQFIAAQLGVTTRTVERWAVRPDIQQAVEQAKSKVIATIEEEVCEKYKRAIEQMIPLALKTLHQTLKGADVKGSDKLRAVQILGKWYGLEKTPVFVKAENQTEPEALLKQYLGAIGGNENGSHTNGNN
jgi:transposase